MGVGHLDIGENLGDAKVFNPMPAIQQYGQILQQRQAKHDAEVKQLADSLAKGYDPSGLRNDADRSAYIKQYNDVKDFAIDAENEKDATKKAMKLAQVKQKLNDLGAFSEGSKKYAQLEQGIAKEHALNQWAVDDNTAKRVLEGNSRVWNHPNNIKGWQDVVRGVDPAKADAIFDKHVKDMIAPTKWDVYKGATETKPGNEGQWEYQKRGIPLHGDNGALESTLHLASANPDFKKSLYDRYPDAKYPDMASKVTQYLTDKGKIDGFFETSKQTFKAAKETDQQKFANARKLHDANRQSDINNPLPTTAIANQQKPSQTLIAGDPTKKIGGLQQGDPAAIQKFISLAPNGQFGKATPKFTIDPNTGEQIYSFPAHYDQKAVEFNNEQKAKYAKEYPGEQYEPGGDSGYPKLKPEILAPAKTYKINPASPDFTSRGAEMAKEQNINLPQLDQIEGVKGGHGQIKQAQPSAKSNYQHVQTAKDSKGKTVTLGYKNGKWYNTQTNQVVE